MIRLARLRRVLGVTVGIAGLVCSGFGQQQGGQSGGTATPAPVAPAAPAAPATPAPAAPQPLTQTPAPAQMRIGVPLSGRVMLDSGTPPAESVAVERLCNGNRRARVYTDARGHFSFGGSSVMRDASEGSLFSPRSGSSSGSGSSGVFDQMGCEIRASLAGYRSDSVNLGMRSPDNPDLGTIFPHKVGNVEGVSISASSLRAPKDAKKAFDKGHDLLKKQKIPDARKELEKAVEIYPGYATAWFDLGSAKEGENDIAGARKAYEQALASDPKYVYPYRQLLGIAIKQRNWQEAADTGSKLLKLDPVDFPEAHYYHAVSNYYLKNYDVAEKSIREAQRLEMGNPNPMSSDLLGAILIEKRDYVGAAEQVRKYLSLIPPNAPEADHAKKQLAALEMVTGTSPATPNGKSR